MKQPRHPVTGEWVKTKRCVLYANMILFSVMRSRCSFTREMFSLILVSRFYRDAQNHGRLYAVKVETKLCRAHRALGKGRGLVKGRCGSAQKYMSIFNPS